MEHSANSAYARALGLLVPGNKDHNNRGDNAESSGNGSRDVGGSSDRKGLGDGSGTAGSGSYPSGL
ncbi:hypothetical protein E2562_020502 [Oryza meyeriana var. granulata]|uniref:Uncharacterized protein n=1 Tax=Oryza meyeriana var. granulata TaxID=110450 RepID=A0A6G1D624_9ORYZ|nr:hypothetical protein E2562_020502 [Oryza meyeriana var. granulata]